MKALGSSRWLVGLCVLVFASSTVAAPRHKKKPADDDATEEPAASDDDDAEQPKKKKAKQKHKDTSDDQATPKDEDGDSDADTKKAKHKRRRDDSDDADDRETKKPKHKSDDRDDTDDRETKKAKHKDNADHEGKKPKHKAKSDDTDDTDDRATKKHKPKADDSDEADDRQTKLKHKPKSDDTNTDDRATKKLKRKPKGDDSDEADDRETKQLKTRRIDDSDDTDSRPTKHKHKPKTDDETKDSNDSSVRVKNTKPKHKAAPDNSDGSEIEMDGAEPSATHVDAPPQVETVAVAPEVPAIIPVALAERSLTLPRHRLEVHGGLPVSVLTLPGAMAGTTTSTTSEGIALGATYGLDANTEIGGDYAFTLNPANIKGPFTVHGAYRVLHAGGGAKLELAIAAGLAVDFVDTVDPMTMTTTTTTYVGLQLGAWARYSVSHVVSLFTGLPAIPNSSASLSKLAFALPPLSYQLAVGLDHAGAIAVDLPVGAGFQVAPNIYAFATIDLAHIRIANTQNAFLFRDFFPLALGGFYSLDKLDVGAVFADDLKQGTDYVRFELMARYVLR